MPLLRTLPFFLTLALAVPTFAGDADDIAALLNKGHADDALQAADRALAKTPRDARLRLLRGNALASLGRTADAIQVFNALTVDYPSQPEPYNNLASLYAQQGQLDKARAALELALQTNKAYATAHANLTDVYARLAAQAYEKALQRDIVERQSGQSAPPAANTAPTRLALIQDMTGHSAVVLAPPATVATAPVVKPPVVVASAKPAESKPVTPVTVPPVAASKPAVAPAQPTVVATVAKPVATPTPATPVAKPATPPVAVVTEKPHDSDRDAEDQINKALKGWADAWSAKHVGNYLAFYGHSFKPSGMSRSAWEEQRKERIEAARKIEVHLSNIRVKLEGDRATVHFVQRYRSDKLDSSTGKTMIMEKAGGHWLISEERVG